VTRHRSIAFPSAGSEEDDPRAEPVPELVAEIAQGLDVGRLDTVARTSTL